MIQIVCDALLFDLDSVLVDSDACIMRHWESWTRQHNIALADVRRIAYGKRTVETIRILAPHLDAEQEAERLTAAAIADTEGVIAMEGAKPLLQALPSDAWAIVTSGSRELALARIRAAGLPFPRVLVSADDVRQGKPAPEPYLAGASLLGKQAPACLVIEDAPAGIQSAYAAGMQVIGIATTHPREELDCPVVVDRLPELRIDVRNKAGDRMIVQIE